MTAFVFIFVYYLGKPIFINLGVSDRNRFFAALMLGGFSRFGSGRQILFAIFLLVVLKMSESFVARPVRADAGLWILNYTPVLIGFIFAFGLLLVASFFFGALNLTLRKKVSQ